MKIIRLGDACTKIGSGATPRGGQEVYRDDGIALIRSQNVYNDGFSRNGLAFIGDEHARQLASVTVQQNDILLNITGDSVARVCQVPADLLPARVNQHVAIIRPRADNLDAGYLRYYLASPVMQQRMLGLAAAGATRNALTKGMIENLTIPCPSLPEQRAIAAVLTALDDKIELNRRINQTLEQMAQALFKSWFVDFDPVLANRNGERLAGLAPEVQALFPSEFEESELGEAPQGWEVEPLSRLCEYIMSGGTPNTQKMEYWGGDVPWLSSGETRNQFIVTTEKTITVLGVSESSTRMARAGSTVIAGAGQGQTRGQTSLLLLDSYINQSVVAVAANHTVTSDLYIFFNLARRYEEFRRISDSHSSRGSLTTKLLGDVRVSKPPMTLVSKFDELVQSIVDRIRANILQSTTLATIRDMLLPKLLSGEVRVRDAEHIVEELM